MNRESNCSPKRFSSMPPSLSVVRRTESSIAFFVSIARPVVAPRPRLQRQNFASRHQKAAAVTGETIPARQNGSFRNGGIGKNWRRTGTCRQLISCRRDRRGQWNPPGGTHSETNRNVNFFYFSVMFANYSLSAILLNVLL